MYTLAFFGLILISGFLIFRGVRSKKRGSLIIGIGLALATLIFFWFMGFWVEKLWFDSIGYSSRFWSEILIKIAASGIGLFIGAAVVLPFAWLIPIPKTQQIPVKTLRSVPVLLSGLIGAAKAYTAWDVIFKFFNQQSTGISDPILGRDAGFYLFSLPFYELLYSLLFTATIFALITSLFPLYLKSQSSLQNYFTSRGSSGGPRDVSPGQEEGGDGRSVSGTSGRGLFLAAVTILLVLLAADKLLQRFRLMLDPGGITVGPGWTDANILMPAYLAGALLALLGLVLIWIPGFRRKIGRPLEKAFHKMIDPIVPQAGSVLLGLILIWFLLLQVVPNLFQSLKVSPNEITLEKPYIGHNIEMTRHAFKLDKITEEEFPVGMEFSRDLVEDNQGTISNIRLWDWRALDSVYKQFQEIRLYYEFEDIDIDRYMIDGEYRSVMVSAREMEIANLPPKSQTFVNERFKYTHGYGITMNTVNKFTDTGLPDLLIKDIPPIHRHESLQVERPEIYYGELTKEYVVVNSDEQEFDYPSGDSNKYVKYSGSGGVQISNFFRKLIFGSRFDGTDFLFSGYQNEESRIMYYRNILERVNRAAPFLTFDNDPYIVLIDGELRWIIDAYTTSNDFPYSERYNAGMIGSSRVDDRREESQGYEGQVNYIRNSVKTVVNPYNGDIDYYIYDESDPIIQTWDRIFPQLFKDKSEMPTELQKHVRYPANLLLIQGNVYAKYHMNDPAVFYNQEDLWVRATEKYYNDVEEVKPYYVMWERPGSDTPEFVVMMPFTPKNRQVLIGWIAGASDPENYGEFISYKFPKDKRVLGTQQVETKIDQDSYLSSQLSLWDQRGSNVVRGNVLAIPIDDTLLYVEPIYLQSETAAYPELRLVAVMHNDNLSYAPTFEEALKGLYTEEAAAAQTGEVSAMTLTSGDQTEQGAQAAGVAPSGIRTLIQDANSAFDEYFRLLGDQRFEEASRELSRLGQVLEQLADQQDTAGQESSLLPQLSQE